MIKILTAGDIKFKDFINKSLKKNESFGYKTIIYDLGNLGFGKKFEVAEHDFERTNKGKTPIANKFKPSMIKDCLDNVESNTTIVYLDADAFLINKIDELDSGEYDLGVTVRGEQEVKNYGHLDYMGPLNSGVLVLKKTDATMLFLNDWIEETKSSLTDQCSLNHLIQKFVDMSKLNEVIEKDGLRVKLFKTIDYNNYYSTIDKEKVKIRHFKGGLKNINRRKV